ncbi:MULTISPECIES: ATP-binding protein [unclassified Chelatococcus]|uniref:ATP-binding protein n=1 Tax=unclassified Chelatococcus TaxID=2638111 RepID=UPI0002D385A0|nr:MULTISPECIES: ATP-binding protein [unclassified Chelatococcus]
MDLLTTSHDLVTGAAALIVVATVVWLIARRRRTLLAQIDRLEAEIETLHDSVWELSESREHYRSLVEAQGDVIVRRAQDGRIIYCNDAFARLAGRSREELVGSHWQPVVREISDVRLSTTGARIFDEAIDFRSGIVWISWIETLAIGDSGAERQRVGRDVTSRVAAEHDLLDARHRAEAASEAKSRFLATVSHEVRTPLNGILGMADLLADTRLDPEQATYVRAVKTSGEVLLSLIDDILDFSKIEAGKIALVQEPFDLRSLVENVVELLAPRAQGKGIEIASFIAPDLPALVMGDRDRLRQVLMNLAGNAVKFTDQGGVGVSIEVEADGHIAFSVADTGPGIPKSRQDAVFREFEQVDDTASRRHGGTGLGLAICRHIVERMGGTITVESEEGRGATFRFAIALASVGGDSRPALPPPTQVDLSGKRVLIIAHSPFEAPFIARRLAAAGAGAEIRESEEAASAAMAAGGYDVVLTDCALGEEAARRLATLARRSGVRRSLVLLSPFERREFGPPAAAGFDGYLVKPVRALSLMQQIAHEPAALPPQQTYSAQAQALPRAGEGEPRRRRVLLAEDNEINALLALKLLEGAGAETLWVRDGVKAVAAMRRVLAGHEEPFDLVLMDARMPEMDGLEAVRRIRAAEAAHPRPVHARIVMLTANAFAEDRAAAMAAGADGFLAKPFERQKIQELVEGADATGAARA